MRKHIQSYLLALALGLAFVAGSWPARGADDLPEAKSFARYEPMMKRSPFAVATAVAIPAATPNFAKDLYIANGARTEGGDFITLASTTDKNFKKYLSTKEPFEGYSILQIDWSDRIGETKVTIGKDGQTAALTFNQALLSQSVGNSAPQAPPPPQPQGQPQQGIGVPPVPQYNNNGVNMIKPAPIPMLPTPPPRVRGVIPRNPNAVIAPAPATLPEAPQGDEEK